jgi:hypothetical protein
LAGRRRIVNEEEILGVLADHGTHLHPTNFLLERGLSERQNRLPKPSPNRPTLTVWHEAHKPYESEA